MSEHPIDGFVGFRLMLHQQLKRLLQPPSVLVHNPHGLYDILQTVL
jgi:hypothetical protein